MAQPGLTHILDGARIGKTLASWRVIIGEIAEEIAAERLGAERQHTGAGYYCPDLKANGVSYEVKAVGQSRTVIIYSFRLEKDREYARTHPLVYALVLHGCKIPMPSVACARQRMIGTARVYAVPFCYVDGIAAVTRPKRFNKKYDPKHASHRNGYERGGYLLRAGQLIQAGGIPVMSGSR